MPETGLYPERAMTVETNSNTAVPGLLVSCRWRMVALLFFATTVNYIDRNVLSFTMIDEGFRRTMLGLPDGTVLTQAHLDLFKERMGYVDAAFKTAYALGFLLVGWFIDRVGTRKGFSRALVVWSLAGDRKSTRLNSSHIPLSRMPSSA